MSEITITGSGFTGAVQCFFGLTAVGITVNPEGTTFISIPPAVGPGGVTLTIKHAGGTATFYPYTYVGSPTTTSLGSTMGTINGGTRVKIFGSNFYDRSAVSFPGFSCGVTFGITYSASALIGGTTWSIVTTPSSSVTGGMTFKFRTPTGTAVGLTFTYIDYCGCQTPSDAYVHSSCITSTGECYNSYAGTGISGCNCCACCEAVCAHTPLCCGENSGFEWDNNCADLVTSAAPGSDIYDACKHLMQGACCVKFNSAGLSYGICLGSEMTSTECSDLVTNLDNKNSGFPWNFPYTINWAQNKTCETGCDVFCNEEFMYYDEEFKCGIPPVDTCSPCGPIFGYCGGCIVDYCNCDGSDPEWCASLCDSDTGIG